MSILYLAADPRSLADQLADDLDQHAKHGDFFTPVNVVVPNRYMRKWLRLWLARRLDVVINLKFLALEDALWQMLHEVDSMREGEAPAEPLDKRKRDAATARQEPRPPEPIDENTYRLMVLSVLLEENDPHLAPLKRYIQMQEPTLTRLTCRRAWYLADRLGTLLRDYEYDRQDSLIQPWLRGEFSLGNAGEFHKMMERAQRALFQHITRVPDGRRALLNRVGDRTLKSFPQYAMELMTGRQPAAPNRIVHFFGFTQVNELHARTIGWLGRYFDIRFHHLNVLANRIEAGATFETIQEFARTFHGEAAENPGRELMSLWSRAGSESLLLASLLSPSFNADVLPAYEPPRPNRRGKRAPAPATVLSRLHDHLLGKTTPRGRMSQDTSLQIVGCPGAVREVETVYNSILHNLQNDSTLRQTDIGVLVTDMPKYRAALQAVFERPPIRVHYNMVDFSAAGTSTFGQALLGMLDLALESFSRARVFQVILNPCFLARLGVDRTQATIWLDWAESLGICQGWDADEKQAQGYPRSPFYAWRLGLQRLRLGRYMEATTESADQPAPRFGHILPFTDLASMDREQLDAFCRAVEGLLPMLARLRTAPLSGERWTYALHRLVQEFLDVPDDRPEEAQVRTDLLAAFDSLTAWDALHPAKTAAMPLALVREYVLSQLEVLAGNRGEYLVGGVTIAALEPMRPVPFPIIYVLGLGEDLFPGSNALSSFDLRGAQRVGGDIRPAEQRLYDFLATILAAERKLYLLYSNHDLQKDQALQPSVPLQQLQRHLTRHVLKTEFESVVMPTQGDDVRLIDATQQPDYQDVLVQYRVAERSLAILAAERAHRLALDLTQQAEWAEKRRALETDFSIPPTPIEQSARPHLVSVRELRRFLYFPADASLRRHLRVENDETRTPEEEEPLVTPQFAGYALVSQALEQLVQASAQGEANAALQGWPERFAANYAESRLRSQVPEEAFGAIDQAALRSQLQERIHGQGGIEAFVRNRAGLSFCGPVLLGESLTPIGARLRFPAPVLRTDAEHAVRIVGATSFAWQSPSRFEVLIVTNVGKLDARQIVKPLIEPVLLYLAMLANAEPNADGIASQAWLARREFVVHVSHLSGVQAWSYPADSITPAEATRYLTELTRDLLDPTQFDLLPFDMLSKHPELRRAFDSAMVAQIAPAIYRQVLDDALTEHRENTFNRVDFPLLVRMIDAKVPDDALAKVQRRFQLLDRGPARNRQPGVARLRN